MLTILAVASRLATTMSGKTALRPLVICGPSGSGKSTLLRLLFEEFPNTFGFSVSHTTRSPRPLEKDGVDYHFVTKEKMDLLIEAGEFIETACFTGNTYGTSKSAVRRVQDDGKVCVLDIEIQGVEQIRRTDLNPVLIYNNPPSLKELERRLRQRNTETEETLLKRLESAKKEIEYGLMPGNFQIIIENDDITTAYKKFRDFIVEEYQLSQSN